MSRQAHPSSFRDPAGFIFTHQNTLYRQINEVGREDYELLMSSGLYQALVDKNIMVAHREIKDVKAFGASAERYKVIQPDSIPFISYPYEWSFAQLQAAAVLTLRLQKIALKHGMILKDASAYNIQFIGQRPIFIDTLSFRKYEVGDAWDGYKQFCEHYVVPLALAHYANPEILRMLSVHIDGVPLRLGMQLLPLKARMQRGLLAHVYIHGKAQERHKGGGEEVAAKTQKRKVSALAMQGLIASLERTVKKLRPLGSKTEWGEYYTFTNYSEHSFDAKKKLVTSLLKQITPTPLTAWDIGANNGEFSELASKLGMYTMAFDIDEVAVGQNYRTKRDDKTAANMLPLVQDLTNISPPLGWANHERMSLIERGPADVVLALALIHHLAIGNNVPLPHVAAFLAKIGKHVIIEFVPKGDSKVNHLLASRKDIFAYYDPEHFEAAMGEYFTLVTKKDVKGSKRSLYLYTVK